MPDEPAVSPTPEEPAPVKVPEPPDAPKTEIPALSNQDEPATAREVEQLTQRTEGPLQRRLLAALASSVSGARASRRVLLRLRLLWPLALLFLCGALLGVATVLFGLPRQAGGWALLTWSVLAVVIVVPRLQAIHFAGTNHREKDWAEVDNSARQTLLQIGGGVVVVVGVVTAYLEYQENAKVSRENLAVASQSLALTEASQRRERFGRALDQLGSDQMALRLAGIFGLEGVSREAGSDQWAVAEILTAYVRTHATRTAPPRSEPRHILQAGPRWPGGVDAVQVAQDVQAALTVLGRNPWPPGFEVVAPSRSTEYYRRYLDLRHTDLRGADLSAFQAASLAPKQKPAPLNPPQRVILIDADLTRAIMTNAHLVAAQMAGARLDQAWLKSVVLTGADLSGGSLIGAALRDANLYDAELSKADLRNADLSDADLRGADLREADLRGADLSGSLLHGADFRDATVSGANFSDANLCRTRMALARGLTPAQLEDASVDEASTLPSGFDRVFRNPALRKYCGPSASSPAPIRPK